MDDVNEASENLLDRPYLLPISLSCTAETYVRWFNTCVTELL